MNCGPSLGRVGVLLSILSLSMMIATAPARAAKFAAIVIDARNGAVLYQRNADRRQHPASLTKMMTLYLTFEAIGKGRLSLNQRIKISRNAASEQPSRLGLKAGQRVTVRDLIRAAAVKSANDAATALAEAVGGSEEKFARMMTRKARELGMTRTRFLNAHGLTRSQHLSTARDLATLGRRLMYDFPQYFNLFGRKKTVTAIRAIRNTNRLLGSYLGMDGIKTGYTRAAGFNLAASARRGDKRIIAVVLGGRSSRTRNAKVAELLDLGFRKAPARVPVVPPGRVLDPSVLVAAVPPRRGQVPPGFMERNVRAITRVVAAPAAAATLPPSNDLVPGATTLAPRRSALPLPRPGIDQERELRLASANVAPGIRPKPRPLVGNTFWAVQLGRYKERDYALQVLRKATRSPAPALRSARFSVDETTVHGIQLYEARFVGLSEASAHATCEKLRAGGQTCRLASPHER